jgi:hypothetical protein
VYTTTGPAGTRRAPESRVIAPRALEPVPDRESADRLAGDREQGVAHGRGDAWQPYLTDPSHGIALRDDVRLDLGHVAHTQDRVAVEVPFDGASMLDRDLTVQGGRQPVRDPAFHLRFDRIGVHDRTAVDRAHHARHADFPIHELHLRHLCHHTSEALRHGAAERPPVRSAGRPVRLLRRQP